MVELLRRRSGDDAELLACIDQAVTARVEGISSASKLLERLRAARLRRSRPALATSRVLDMRTRAERGANLVSAVPLRSQILLMACVALACTSTSAQETADATVEDAAQASSDALVADASDAAPPDAAAPPPPSKLSATGLFADIDAGAIASDAVSFEPRYALWSDDASKTRWVRLPANSEIDTTNMDHWSLPVGTRLWKEFRVNGVRVETRMIERWGPGRNDFIYAPYRWNSTLTDADYVPAGVPNANGTTHDIPPLGACDGCHSGLREHVLGFSAIQLSQSSGAMTLETLASQGRLTAAPSGVLDVPGNATERAALGYLHANCGNCHNADDGVSFVTPFSMRLLVSDATVAQTGAYKTTINVITDGFKHPGVDLRVAPGDAGASAVYYRMAVRGLPDQMPPVATKVADPIGQLSVKAWISSLPP